MRNESNPFGQDLSTYLKSKIWKERSRKFVERAGWQCGSCGDHTGPWTVWHKITTHLGDERARHVLVVCQSCWIKRFPETSPPTRWIKKTTQLGAHPRANGSPSPA